MLYGSTGIRQINQKIIVNLERRIMFVNQNFTHICATERKIANRPNATRNGESSKGGTFQKGGVADPQKSRIGLK
jgi:hypothetical protein